MNINAALSHADSITSLQTHILQLDGLLDILFSRYFTLEDERQYRAMTLADFKVLSINMQTLSDLAAGLVQEVRPIVAAGSVILDEAREAENNAG